MASREDAAKPPSAGNVNTSAAVESQRPEGVHDRVPAAVALESPDETHAHAHERHAESQSHAQATPQEATDLEQPQTVSQPEQQQEKKNPTPVFVPIVVSMDDRDHKLLVEEWYSRQMVSACMSAAINHVMTNCIVQAVCNQRSAVPWGYIVIPLMQSVAVRFAGKYPLSS